MIVFFRAAPAVTKNVSPDDSKMLLDWSIAVERLDRFDALSTIPQGLPMLQRLVISKCLLLVCGS